MYAVITSGGKQYKVSPGQNIKLEKLDVEVGGKVEFPVLMIVNDDKVSVGNPLVKDHKVSAEVVSHGRGKKIMIIKMRRRKHSRKQMGHRQDFTEVKVTEIH